MTRIRRIECHAVHSAATFNSSGRDSCTFVQDSVEEIYTYVTVITDVVKLVVALVVVIVVYTISQSVIA